MLIMQRPGPLRAPGSQKSKEDELRMEANGSEFETKACQVAGK
jgi:hypothetical protein